MRDDDARVSKREQDLNALQTGGREEGFGMPSDGIAAITQRLNGAAASFEARVEKKEKGKRNCGQKTKELTSSCFCRRPLKGMRVCVRSVRHSPTYSESSTEPAAEGGVTVN